MNKLDNIKQNLTQDSNRLETVLHHEQQLFRYKNYSYCVAKPHHRNELLQLNIQSRAKLNPFFISFARFRSDFNAVINETLYWNGNSIFDEITTNDLSVVCLDRNNNNQIVAASCGICAASSSDPYSGVKDCEFYQTFKAFTSGLFAQLSEQIVQKMKIKGLVYKLTAGVGRLTLTQRGIFARTYPLALEQAKKKGFKYIFAYCTTYQTRKLVKQDGMQIVAEGDLKTFEYKGQRPFALVDEINRYPCFAWKEL